MMIRNPHPIVYPHVTESNTGNPATPGTSVVAGFSNADGTAVAIIGTPLAHDVQLLEVTIASSSNTFVTATSTSMMVDLLIDPAGGTSWDTTNIFCEGLMYGFMGSYGASGQNCRKWTFPIWIPAGATIAGRARSEVASGNVTALVSLIARGGARPGSVWYGQKIDAIGIDKANSKGTSITPGASSNTYPSFASFGSATARRYGCLLPSIALNTATQAGGGNRQLQIGISSASIGPTFNYQQASTENGTDLFEDKRIYRDIPEGTQLQARIRTNSTSSSADQLIIHGVA